MLGTQEEAYEWYKSYADFRHLVAPHLTPGARILVLGCGNSALPLDLHADGFQRLTCLDISPSVIRQMQGRADAQVLVFSILRKSVLTCQERSAASAGCVMFVLLAACRAWQASSGGRATCWISPLTAPALMPSLKKAPWTCYSWTTTRPGSRARKCARA